jgi:hypothetical protein
MRCMHTLQEVHEAVAGALSSLSRQICASMFMRRHCSFPGGILDTHQALVNPFHIQHSALDT